MSCGKFSCWFSLNLLFSRHCCLSAKSTQSFYCFYFLSLFWRSETAFIYKRGCVLEQTTSGYSRALDPDFDFHSRFVQLLIAINWFNFSHFCCYLKQKHSCFHFYNKTLSTFSFIIIVHFLYSPTFVIHNFI